MSQYFSEASLKQISSLMKQYRKYGKKYIFTRQNESVAIESTWGSSKTKNTTYTIQEINFIKSVKQYIIKNQLYKPWEGKIAPIPKYYGYGAIKPGDSFKDVVNVDISNAYWETAWKIGLLSEDLYKKGIEPPIYETKMGKKGEYKQLVSGIRKQVRLAAIGSLAKKVLRIEFDGEKSIKLPPIRQVHTEILWNVICHEVGKLLTKIAKSVGDDFIFFWVDGIYVKKRSQKKVCKMFSEAGYAYKINQLKKIDVRETNIFVNPLEPFTVIKDGKEIIRTYKPFPFNNKKRG